MEPRGDGSDLDIGADEYFAGFNLSSDVHPDLWIDFLDLFTFSSGWYQHPVERDVRDIDYDQDINSLDLVVLLKDWGQGTGAAMSPGFPLSRE